MAQPSNDRERDLLLKGGLQINTWLEEWLDRHAEYVEEKLAELEVEEFDTSTL